MAVTAVERTLASTAASLQAENDQLRALVVAAATSGQAGRADTLRARLIAFGHQDLVELYDRVIADQLRRTACTPSGSS